VPGCGSDHRCRHRRSWPDRLRGERVESVHGFGQFRRGFAHDRNAVVLGYGSIHVTPVAIGVADSQAFRYAVRDRHGVRAHDEFPACDEFPNEREFRDAQFHGARHPR
jgi:hypothetical protein